MTDFALYTNTLAVPYCIVAVLHIGAQAEAPYCIVAVVVAVVHIVAVEVDRIVVQVAQPYCIARFVVDFHIVVVRHSFVAAVLLPFELQLLLALTSPVAVALQSHSSSLFFGLLILALRSNNSHNIITLLLLK